MLYLVAVVLRVLLSLNGGQLFLRDEVRYWRLPYYAYALVALDPREATEVFWNTATPHFGYHLINAPVSLLYAAASFLTGTQMDFLAPPVLTIALAPLSASPVLLAYALADAAGAPKREATMAAFLMLCATSLFYFSRHLVPYDASLAVILFGMWAGMQPSESERGWQQSLLVGLIVGLGFLTYFGYWMIAGIALITHVLWQQQKVIKMAQRAVASALGVIMWPVALTAITLLQGVEPFISGMRGFSGSITQGQFAEGWRLVWEYLWQTEKWLLIVALLLIGLGLAQSGKNNKRLLLWVGISAGLYVVLALVSTGLEMFVIYGRLARQLTPFLLLAAAASFMQIFKQRRAKNLAIATIGLVSFANLMLPYMLQYPYQFGQRALTNIEQAQRTDTVRRHDFAYILPNSIDDASAYVLVNASFFYPINAIGEPPQGDVIIEAAHPFEYPPYQYNGHELKSRQLLREQGLSMYLIKLDDP